MTNALDQLSSLTANDSTLTASLEDVLSRNTPSDVVAELAVILRKRASGANSLAVLADALDAANKSYADDIRG